MSRAGVGPGGDGNLAKSGPERPDPEEGSILHPARPGLPPMRPRIGAIGHAEHDAPLSVVNRRHLMVNQCAFKDDERIRGGAIPISPPPTRACRTAWLKPCAARPVLTMVSNNVKCRPR
jgi:hypothetical protein